MVFGRYLMLGTWTLKVCKTMAFWAVSRGVWVLCYIHLGVQVP